MTIGDGQPAGVAGIIRRVRYRNEVQQHGLRVLQLLNGRVALDRLQPERGVDAHADRVRPLSGALRKAVFAVPPPCTGRSVVDTCSLVVSWMCWPAMAGNGWKKSLLLVP